jgi:type 1 glutamine amidotransferase
MKKALIFWGGWKGHDPDGCAKIIDEGLRKRGFDVTCDDHMEALKDADALKRFDLIVPIWTMGELPKECSKHLDVAVNEGTGFAGFHGGTGDAFRGNLNYEWMTGGHFVGHPYVGKYTVYVQAFNHPITEGMPASFEYESEQYYMMIDPAVELLASTVYVHNGKAVSMPVAWTSKWGKGRVFYSALGHKSQEFLDYPQVLEMTLRGMEWASR